MAQVAAERMNLRRVIRAVHQVVERGHPLRRQLRQGNRHLRIMHAGTGQHRADREIPVNGVQVQLVANPAFLVPFAVALATHVTTGGQVSQVLGQRARRLEFQAFRR